MEIRVLKITLWACLLFMSGGATAQFSISKVSSSKALEMKSIEDSIRPMSPLRNIFFNKAQWLAEKRAVRKERNTWELNTGLQMSQTQFENWAGGGDNTFSGRASLFFRHKYVKRKFSVESKIEAKYGLNYIEGKSYKNEDEFKINLVSGWQMHDYWSYAASVNLRSQFATGYKSRKEKIRKSTFMAPGFLDMSLGFKYSRNSTFSFIISPVGGNAVFMLDDELSKEGLNGLEKNKKSRWTVGPSFRAELDKEFVKKIFRLRSTFNTFTNLKKTPTVRWETSIDIKATKLLTTTIFGMLNYDRDADTPKYNSIQYKYSFAVGLTYRFKNK